MCGILGYVGSKNVANLLVEGLKRLEYRGYDSCGVAVLSNGSSHCVRVCGGVASLEERLASMRAAIGNGGGPGCGIGHTRWATHGRPSESNAHPHVDCKEKFLVVHNGIIENHGELKRRLESEGHSFRTETDTEVLPHLVESCYRGDLAEAVREASRRVEGLFSFVAVSPLDPVRLVAVRKGPPLVVGRGVGENFLASDIPAVLPFTQEVTFLNNGEVVVVEPDRVSITDLEGRERPSHSERITWSAEAAEKGGAAHFTLKEILDQPESLRDTLTGRTGRAGLRGLAEELEGLEPITATNRFRIVACGTSLHAGLIGRFMIESLAHLPVEVEYASEFRYRRPRLGPNEVVVAITQSGETADTLAALEEGRAQGGRTLAICNNLGSMAARISDAVLYTRAGPEIGVASTKAFTTQLVALYLLALLLGERRGVLSPDEVRLRLRALEKLPRQVEAILERAEDIRRLAERHASQRDFLYIGRGVSYPVAMEGALKLKEISYIHAEGYPAGELKHGPLALVDPDMRVVAVAPNDDLRQKMASNIEEVKSRGGKVIAVVSEGDEPMLRDVEAISIPQTQPLLSPILAAVPLQLFAYHVAVARGCDVDKPRNLAKSVTVE